MCSEDANIIVTNNGSALWLGNARAALDCDFLTKNNISVIVNCTADVPFVSGTYDKRCMKFESVRIPIYDTPSSSDNDILKTKFEDVINFIYLKFFIEGKNVLIHCRAGVSRSATVTLAFLFSMIKKHTEENHLKSNLNDNQIMKNIITYMLNKRQCVFFYGTKLNFKNALDNYFNTDIILY